MDHIEARSIVRLRGARSPALRVRALASFGW
jgi:hypothetical protein